MKRICILMTVVLVALMLFSTVYAAENVSNRIPRVVSIVFDDSGSMYQNTDRWAYTSYAMQAFTAMMGSEDMLFVTYLNNVTGDGEVALKEGRQNSVDGFCSTLFGGGTPNRLADGVNKLAEVFDNGKRSDAKYYLVVMSDGDLDLKDQTKTKVLPELKKVVETAKNGGGDYEFDESSFNIKSLSGADFEAIYFSMASKETTPGIECYHATDADSIISELMKVSESIMGRTNVSKEENGICSISDGVINVKLPYPVHSITLFAQKITPIAEQDDTVFSGVGIPVPDGCRAETYYVKCPENVNDIINTEKTVWKGKNPVNHLGGFVTVITDKDDKPGETPIIPKGEYTINVSEYVPSSENIAVLAEPAVKVGCKYAVDDGDGDDTNDVYGDFNDIKGKLRIGETVKIKCGLYELKPDGTLGDAVSSDVLPAGYEFYINGGKLDNKEVKIAKDGAYCFALSEKYSTNDENELKVKAVLKTYKPSEVTETYGKLSKKPVISGNVSSGITLKKTDLEKLLSFGISVEFPLREADTEMLKSIEIKADGYDGFKTGVCNALTDCVKISGNSIVYTLVPKEADFSFSSLADEFTISLVDKFDGTSLAKVKVTVIQPKYKFEPSNGLKSEKLGIDKLEGNKSSVGFTLVADYDGKGKYTKINKFDLEKCVRDLKLEKGGFSGEEKIENGTLSFVPVYTGEETEKFFDEKHAVYASACVDGKTITSEKLEFSVIEPKYSIEIKNGITSSLTPSSLRENTEKITFSIVADYNGDGKNDPLTEKDLAENKNITVEHKTLTGEITIDGGDKKPAGVSFTPFYDEKKNKDIDLSSLVGEHTIVARTEKCKEPAEFKIIIDKVSYIINVTSEITDKLSPNALKNNTQKIIFTVLADYEGNGENYQPLAEWDTAIYDALVIDKGGLCGTEQMEKDGKGKSFIPLYTDKDADFSSFLGRDYEIKATLNSRGVSSEAVTVSVGEVKYNVKVENGISTPLTMYTLKDNAQKVIFTVYADYDGNGNFTDVAEWDTVYDRLTIKSENENKILPGTVTTEYDAKKRVVGKSFTPSYDKDISDIAFTKVAGHTHTVRAYINGEEYGAAQIKVDAPKFDVKVMKDGLELVDVKLRENKECIVFEVSCNGHILTAKELEGLKPYNFTLSKNSKRITINTYPSKNPDGTELLPADSNETAYLACCPIYKSWAILNWRSVLTMEKGDMQITLTVENTMATEGEDGAESTDTSKSASATANIHINTDKGYWMCVILVLIALAVIAWFVFCFFTRMRFQSGKFYKATFSRAQDNVNWVVSTVVPYKSNQHRFKMFFKSRFFLPFAHQRKVFSLSDFSHKAAMETKRGISMFDFVSYPFWKVRSEKEFLYNKGSIPSKRKMLSIIKKDRNALFAESDIKGSMVTKRKEKDITLKMGARRYISEISRENDKITIFFFLSSYSERRLRKLGSKKKNKKATATGVNSKSNSKNKTNKFKKR